MRVAIVLCLAASSALITACSKPATDNVNSGAAVLSAASTAQSSAASTPTVQASASTQSPVSGAYTCDGAPATLTQITTHPDDPEMGKPVTALVITANDQGGDPKAAFNALFNKYGDAIVVHMFADGTIYSADMVHSKLDAPGGSAQLSGVLKIENFSTANGEISGHLTSDGPVDVHGQKLNVDITFHAKAP
jgi:hypothetical protein